VSENPQSRIDQCRQEIANLRQSMNGFVRSVDEQRRALQQLYSAIANSTHRSVAQRALQGSVNVSNTARQLASRMPVLENMLSRLCSDITAMDKEHDQLLALSEIGAVISSTLDLPQVLNSVMDNVIQLTGAERGYIVLRDEDTGNLEFTIARGMDRETLEHRSSQVSRTIVTKVAETGEPVVTTNAQADPRFHAQESVVSYSLRSILCVPLRVRDHVIGVMYADNRIKSGLFAERERDLLTTFANQAAVAIDNARLFARISYAQRLMANIFASITSGVITTDTLDKITLLNRAAEAILGIQPGDHQGIHYREALEPLEEVLPPLIDQVKETDSAIQDFEAEPEVPGRGQISLNVTLSPLKDAENETQGVAIVFNDVTERKRFERERGMVKRYLPTELVDSFADLQELRLGGERAEVTILFADIRGFTSFSERNDPEQVVETINNYYEHITRIIRENQGIVDKYEGDAVMAHYGTPLLPIEDHAWKAVLTAWQSRLAIRAYHEQIDPADRLYLKFGINTGEAVAGNVGGHEQMDYTLIGDAVNISRRLQQNATGDRILLGADTYDLVRDKVRVKQLDPMPVKGREALVEVYEVTDLIEQP
jgi:PAS domain S-box-containing protein